MCNIVFPLYFSYTFTTEAGEWVRQKAWFWSSTILEGWTTDQQAISCDLRFNHRIGCLWCMYIFNTFLCNILMLYVNNNKAIMGWWFSIIKYSDGRTWHFFNRGLVLLCISKKKRLSFLNALPATVVHELSVILWSLILVFWGGT